MPDPKPLNAGDTYGTLLDAQKAYDDEVTRVKQVRANVIPTAKKMVDQSEQGNIRPMDMKSSNPEYNYCNAYSNTCYNRAGATTIEDINFPGYYAVEGGPNRDRFIPAGSPHPQIAGNPAEQGVLSQEGFKRIPTSDLQPGDRIKKEIFTDKVSWQRDTEGGGSKKWIPGHSAVYAGKGEDGNPDVYESGGGYRDYHKGDWNYSMDDQNGGDYNGDLIRSRAYRYYGNTDKYKADLEEAKVAHDAALKVPLEKMTLKETKAIENYKELKKVPQEIKVIEGSAPKNKERRIKRKNKLQYGGPMNNNLPQYGFGSWLKGAGQQVGQRAQGQVQGYAGLARSTPGMVQGMGQQGMDAGQGVADRYRQAGQNMQAGGQAMYGGGQGAVQGMDPRMQKSMGAVGANAIRGAAQSGGMGQVAQGAYQAHTPSAGALQGMGFMQQGAGFLQNGGATNPFSSGMPPLMQQGNFGPGGQNAFGGNADQAQQASDIGPSWMRNNSVIFGGFQDRMQERRDKRAAANAFKTDQFNANAPRQEMTQQSMFAPQSEFMQDGGATNKDSEVGPGGYGTIGEYNMSSKEDKAKWDKWAASKLKDSTNAMAPGWKPTLEQLNNMDYETRQAYDHNFMVPGWKPSLKEWNSMDKETQAIYTKPKFQDGGSVDWGKVIDAGVKIAPAVISAAGAASAKNNQAGGGSGGGDTAEYDAAQQQYLQNKQQMDMMQNMMQMYAMNQGGGRRGGGRPSYGGNSFGGYSPQAASAAGMTYYRQGGKIGSCGCGRPKGSCGCGK